MNAAGDCRLFTALPLSAPLKERLGALQHPHPRLVWARPAALHLTLRFIGAVPAGAVPKIREALRSVRCAPFTLTLCGTGLFERRNSAILWAGIREKDAAAALKESIDRALATHAHIPRDRGGYQPHITLGRLKTAPDPGLRLRVKEMDALIAGRMDVTAFTLFTSVLHPDGARHEALETYALGCPDD